MDRTAKPIRLTGHAVEQAQERGTNEEEIREAIFKGTPEVAKHGRFLYRHSRHESGTWQRKPYTTKQVAPVVAEEENEWVVITVYTFYY
jgi:hypothetical protein